MQLSTVIVAALVSLASAQAPSAQAPSALASSSQAPSAQASSSQAPSAQASSSQAPSSPAGGSGGAIISVTAPLQGASYKAGDKAIISWINPSVQTISQIVLAQGGSNSLQPVSTIATNVPAASGSYTWNIPADTAPGSDYAFEFGTSPNLAFTGQFSITAGGSSGPSTNSSVATSGPSSAPAAGSSSKPSSGSSSGSAAQASSSSAANSLAVGSVAMIGTAMVAVAHFF